MENKEKKVNYYEDIVIKIKEAIGKKNYVEASELLKEELSMPYIPAEFEKIFKSLFKECNMNILTNDQETGIKQISIDRIVDIFKKFNGEDIEEIQMVLSYFSVINLRKDIDTIVEFFKYDNLDNWIKTELFFLLVDQSVVQDVELNGKTIKTDDYTSFNELGELAEISSILEKNLFQNSTTLNVTLNLLEFYLKTKFPILPKKDSYNEYGAAFNALANKLLNLEVNVERLAKEYDVEVSGLERVIKEINDK